MAMFSFCAVIYGSAGCRFPSLYMRDRKLLLNDGWPFSIVWQHLLLAELFKMHPHRISKTAFVYNSLQHYFLLEVIHFQLYFNGVFLFFLGGGLKSWLSFSTIFHWWKVELRTEIFFF